MSGDSTKDWNDGNLLQSQIKLLRYILTLIKKILMLILLLLFLMFTC